jgi:preprotein translocase SecE subunit
MAENTKMEKKPNIFVRMFRGIAKFFRDCVSEGKKIVWMPWKDVWKNSVLVIICAVVISAVIALLDVGLSNALRAIGSLV